MTAGTMGGDLVAAARMGKLAILAHVVAGVGVVEACHDGLVGSHPLRDGYVMMPPYVALEQVRHLDTAAGPRS